MSDERAYTVGVVHGDGIGPEIVPGAVRVCEAAARAVDAEIRWREVPAGRVCVDAGESALPVPSVSSLEECDGVLLGPVDHATYPRHADGRRQNPSGELRRHFDLYANVRPARTYAGVPSVAADVDLVIVRENTEGFYSDRNMARGTGAFSPTADVALSVGVFTRAGVTRVTQFALDLALRRRRHLTVVHKANVLPDTTGMYIDVAAELAQGTAEIAIDDLHVDAMAAALVRRPSTFDVIVTENLFGDVLSDLASELVGSLGLAASLNVGESYAMAQAAHGSAPDIAGRNLANPTSEILSAAMLLAWLGERHCAARLTAASAAIQAAVADALESAPTHDLGGSASTEEFVDAVTDALRAPVS